MTSSWNGLQNAHKGEIGLVIGNGPSLNQIPLDFLGKFPSFGTNKIYLLDGFQPTYYCAVNPLVIEQVGNRIRDIDYDAKFITAFYTEHLVEDAFPLYSAVLPSFSREPDKWVYEGFTVTYVCLQLAFYMGFDTVLLVGIDHRYEFDGIPNAIGMAEGPDINHFHPDYFSNFQDWHYPDLKNSEKAYQIAKRVYEHDGRRIVNLTPDSALDVFEKGDWREW